MTRSVGIVSLVCALILAAGVIDAAAQSSRYETWPPGGPARAGSGAPDALVDELRALVEEAERARAADPRFLRDLKALVRRHDWPWREPVLTEDFADGDYTRNPAWQVVSGGFRVERGIGLRTLDAPVATAGSSTQQSDDPGRDLAIALIGSILQQRSGSDSGSSTAAPQQPASGVIRTALAIPNAFAIDADLRSGRAEGLLELAITQGATGQSGYRLAYLPGQSPSLELRRVGRRGMSVVAAHFERLELDDGQPHRVVWTRDRDGTMRVKIDDRDILQTVDQGFRDPFAWIEVAYTGGSFAVSRIAVSGAR